MPITILSKKSGSFVRSPQEPRKRHIPWGKHLYVGILVVAAAWGVKWVVSNMAFLEGKGILDAELVSVKSKLTSRIGEVRVRVEDRVSRGEPLVILDEADIQREIASKRRELQEEGMRLEQRIAAARSELKLLARQREEKEVLADAVREDLTRARKLLAEECVTRGQCLVLERELMKTEGEVAVLATSRALAAEQVAKLEREYGEYKAKTQQELRRYEDMLSETVLCAPLDGIVTEVLQRPGEVVRTGDVVLQVADPSTVHIKTYFGERHEGQVKPGDRVDIVFENGICSEGRVRKVYPQALVLTSEYKKAYGPQERAIIAEVEPVNGASWLKILKTKARVLLGRGGWSDGVRTAWVRYLMR